MLLEVVGYSLVDYFYADIGTEPVESKLIVAIELLDSCQVLGLQNYDISKKRYTD